MQGLGNQFGRLGYAPRPSSGGSAPAAPAVNDVFIVAGDSWTEGNQSKISRDGAIHDEDRWDYQLAQLLYGDAIFNYTDPSTQDVVSGVLNAGYGGQTSQTIYNNISALLLAEPAKAQASWQWWGGRNNYGTDEEEANVKAYQQSFLDLMPHDRKLILPPSMGGSIVGSSPEADWVRQNRVRAHDWRNFRRYTFNHQRYWWGIHPYGSDPDAPALLPSARRRFTGAIDGTSLTVSSGTMPAVGDVITGTGVAAGTVVVAGSSSPFTVSVSQQVVSTDMVGDPDSYDVSNQALITSLCASAGGAQDHPNYVSSPMIAAALLPVVKALQNKAVYVLEQTIPDVSYDMAAGQTLEVYFKGFVTACSIAQDDAAHPGLFSIAMKPGSTDTALLTRTSTSPGHIPAILNLRIKADGIDASGAAKTHTNDVRILPSIVGAASTKPVGATFVRDSIHYPTLARWPRLSWSVSPFTNDAKFTLVMCFKPGEDGSNMNLVVFGSQTVVINRQGGNKVAIVVRDSTNAVLMNWTTLTTNFNVAGGETWLAFSIDLSTLRANAYSGRSGSDVNISAAGAVSAGTGVIGLGVVPPSLFVASQTSYSTFTGSVKTVWMAQGAYFDFSEPTVRRLFWNTDGTAVDLGSTGLVAGARPTIYLPGAPGDWLLGRNFGSGPDGAFHDNWLSNQGQSSEPLPY